MAKRKHDETADPQGIHLVGREERRSEPGHDPVSNRIEIGEYIADILIDRRSYPTVVHWIVQRRGNPEILQWGHEDTFEDAHREAVAWIESLQHYDEYREQLNR